MHEYTADYTEFRGVHATTFANADTLVNVLRHYNANGRGRDVWRSRYKVNRFLREDAARSSRNEVRIDTHPRPRPPSSGFLSGFRTNRRDGDDSDDDHDHDRRFGRGGRPPGGGGPGNSGGSPDHVHEYMAPARGRRPRSRDGGSIHIVEAREPPPDPGQERRPYQGHGERIVVDERARPLRPEGRSDERIVIVGGGPGEDNLQQQHRDRIVVDERPRQNRQEHGTSLVVGERPRHDLHGEERAPRRRRSEVRTLDLQAGRRCSNTTY